MLVAEAAVPFRHRRLAQPVPDHARCAGPAGRLLPTPISTICLPTGPQTGACGASGPGAPGRERFPLGRRCGEDRGTVCLDVNTQGGMTGTSPVGEIAAHAGVPLVELVGWMVEDASLDR